MEIPSWKNNNNKINKIKSSLQLKSPIVKLVLNSDIVII
jgi:hypothetical protein